MAALHEDRLDSSAKLLQEIMNAPDKGIPEAAAHAVLMKLFPEQKASLDAAYAASLAQIPDGSGKTAGIGVGEEVTGKILALRTSDGADAPNTYRPSTATGVYVPTTLPIGSQWGNVTPRGDGRRSAVPASGSSGFEERGMGSRLQPGKRSGREKQHGADSRANRDCALLGDYGPSELGSGRAPTGRGSGKKLDRECAIVCVGGDGRGGCLYCGVRREVHIQISGGRLQRYATEIWMAMTRPAVTRVGNR